MSTRHYDFGGIEDYLHNLTNQRNALNDSVNKVNSVYQNLGSQFEGSAIEEASNFNIAVKRAIDSLDETINDLRAAVNSHSMDIQSTQFRAARQISSS